MLIDNTRLIFGPERGYTTSIYNYFKNSEGNYYTTEYKEFILENNTKKADFEIDKRNTNITNDIYLKGYDPKDVYIDCSFTYFGDYIENNTNISFTNDVLIYNLRDLNSFINSMYVTMFYNFLFRREFDYTTIMDSLLGRIYNIIPFFVRLRVDKQYKGKIYFIQNNNFNINNILEYFMLEPIRLKKELPVLNTNLNLINSLKYRRLNSQENMSIYKEHEDILINMKKYINKYQKEIEELNEKNIKALKICNFILGDFDEEKFREEFNNNKITDDYVNKIISELPKG